MADNVEITAGSGTTVHADEYTHTTLGAGKTQLVKLVDGTLDAQAAIAADIGAKANALRVAPASDISDATYIGDVKFGEAEPNSAAILSDTTAIKTAVELLDNAVDGSYLNVNANIAGTDFVGGAGAVAAGVQRVTLASDDPGVALLATIDADTGAIKTAVELLDNAISGTEMQVDVVAALPAGSNAIGKLAANTGVDIGNVGVTSLVPGVAATSLGKARDTALGATDTGVMALAVRDDSLTTLTPIDGDFVPLRVNSTGSLHVTGGGGGTEYTEDAATANPIVGSTTVMERDDALSALVPIEGDWAAFRCSAEGALWVQEFNSDAILADTASMDTSLGTVAGAVTGTEMQVDIVAALPVGDNNIGNVDIASSVALNVSAATVTVSGTVTANAGTNLNTSTLALEAGGNLATVAGDTTSIDGKIAACNTGAVVLATGTASIGKLAANTGVDIGDVDVTSVPAPLNVVGGGTEAAALRVTIANDSTGVVSIDDGGGALTVDGTVTANLSATDNAVLDSIDTATTATQAAVEIMDDWDAVHAAAAATDGPQIMGAAYSIGLPTDVGADADAARICTDRFGRVLAGIMPQNFQATFNSVDAQVAAPVKVKTVDRKMYILSLVLSTDTAMSVQFQDDIGPTVLIENLYLAANGGAMLTWPPAAPLVVNTNADFDIIASVAGNISVTVTGYLAV